MPEDDVIEQTLFICSDVHVYRIPPRSAAGGHRSGTWRVADEIFKGRLRFIAAGKDAELRFEEVPSGELFALAPVRPGERHLVVEPVTDSSRNFVVRVENPETSAHAFLGMGFETRDVAFDFSAALEDNERRLTRDAAGGTSSSSEMNPEVAALHKPVADYSLKEGETIRVDIKNKLAAPKRSGGASMGSVPVPKIVGPPPGPPSPQEPSKTTGSDNWATFE